MFKVREASPQTMKYEFRIKSVSRKAAKGAKKI
jgi:hypothetical protein